ncbi:SprT-like domain-containing protein [Ruania halotolerans]|uniref:SprT-like domain-containing protein n=1 Tax=Ruania halotolerans TaxID=2897773 RepID=UPI001E3CA4A9|nr:SprT-like domain-containing protein [Ruania halotolerans]UFU06826.1 SprT-like domain-containing protein [Ruania halotolerans]
MDLNTALELGRQLLNEHGLTEWQLRLDSARRRAGLCRYDTRTISLSRHLVPLLDDDAVRDTVLHEIAHALAGPRSGHGPRWRQIAVEIGASGQRCLPADAPAPPAPWEGYCRAGHVHQRYRRPTRPLACARCARRFTPEHLITWRFHGAEVDLGPQYAAALAQVRQRAR